MKPARFPAFPQDAVHEWLPLIARRVEEAGVPGPEARVTATVVIAGYRGLLLDVLATGDLDRATEALGFFLAAIEQRLTPAD